jgi:hydrogenase expression/formation protein HypE
MTNVIASTVNGHDILAGGGAAGCPLPFDDDSVVQLAHGGGGRKTAHLIEKLLVPAFRAAAAATAAVREGAVDIDAELADAALLSIAGGPGGVERLAFTTDSFVVAPRFFPGGDIGSLAVHGTVNDLAMAGARPLALSLALVLEEGLPMGELRRVVESIAAASAAVGVAVVTGDTKVVERGKGDGVYINTTGIGRVRAGIELSPANCRPGDAVLVSGPIGDHGIAVMAARNGLRIETDLVSDSAPVVDLVHALLDAAPGARVLRDPTRGGLATALCEIAVSSRAGICIVQDAVPIRPAVRAACELLGFDPLYVACEGRFLAVVPADQAAAALAALRSLPAGAAAARIGEVVDGDGGRVLLRTAIGSHRRLEKLSGEQLPRIC